MVKTPEESGKIIPFPCLIHQVLEFQRQVELLPNEIPEPAPLAYKLDGRVGAVRAQCSSTGFVFGAKLVDDLKHLSTLLLHRLPYHLC